MIKPHNLTGCLFWVSVHVKDEARWCLRSFLVFWFLYTHLHCGMDSFLSHPLSSRLPEPHASLLFPCFNFHLQLVSLFHDTDLPFHWAALPPSQQVGKVGRREQGLWYWFRVSLALVEKWGVAFKGHHPASTWHACSFPWSQKLLSQVMNLYQYGFFHYLETAQSMLTSTEKMRRIDSGQEFESITTLETEVVRCMLPPNIRAVARQPSCHFWRGDKTPILWCEALAHYLASQWSWPSAHFAPSQDGKADFARHQHQRARGWVH